MVVVKAAGYIIFRRVKGDIEFLLLQAMSKAHHWNPPKGHLDPGECEEEAAIREVEEETGLKLSDLSVYHGFRRDVQYTRKNRIKRVSYWLAELKDPNKAIILSHEHQGYKWLSVQEASKLASYAVVQDLIKECYNFLQENNKFETE